MDAYKDNAAGERPNSTMTTHAITPHFNPYPHHVHALRAGS